MAKCNKVIRWTKQERTPTGRELRVDREDHQSIEDTEEKEQDIEHEGGEKNYSEERQENSRASDQHTTVEEGARELESPKTSTQGHSEMNMNTPRRCTRVGRKVVRPTRFKDFELD